MHPPAKSIICIKIIILGFVGDQVFGIYSSTEPFYSIILCIGDKNVVELCTTANSCPPLMTPGSQRVIAKSSPEALDATVPAAAECPWLFTATAYAASQFPAGFA